MRRVLFAIPLLATAVAASTRLAAQAPTGVPAVDSASVARAAWARATAALRASDITAARREVDRAAAAWPTQPAYLWGRAVIALRARDTLALLESLRAYADLGLGRDLTIDSTLASFARLPAFAEVATRHAANWGPMNRSRVRATLPDSTFWPEGVDVDPRTGRMYVASIRHRTIAELSPDGQRLRELLPPHAKDVGAILGVRVDTALGVLWATMAGLPQMGGYAPGDSALHALLRIRLSDGTIERRWDLPPSPAGHTLGDVALGPAGDVFVTDSRDPVLYRLRHGGDTLEPIRHPLFRSLQGMAPTPDGKSVYVADYSHGLLRVDLATGGVTRLAEAPGTTSLGCDGIAWDRGAIVAVQNGVLPPRVVRFVLDAGGSRIERTEVLDRNLTIADEPTIGAIVGGEFVYVANSQWEKYDEAGVLRQRAVLRQPVLLAVPLPR
jgi:DNA-binding beta-propeller fold protein YncE